MDFKAQLASDMKVFHNCGEMATMTDIWYQGKKHYLPIIIDHTAADERQRGNGDNAEVETVLLVWSICRYMILVAFQKKDASLKLTKPGQSICITFQKQTARTGK